jgi:RNA recognition motif-containing protein
MVNRTSLFVTGLPRVEDGAAREDMEEKLFGIFKDYSPVACRVVPGKGCVSMSTYSFYRTVYTCKWCRRYAFVNLQSPDAAASALNHLNRHDTGEFVLTVSYSKHRFKG